MQYLCRYRCCIQIFKGKLKYCCCCGLISYIERFRPLIRHEVDILISCSAGTIRIFIDNDARHIGAVRYISHGKGVATVRYLVVVFSIQQVQRFIKVLANRKGIFHGGRDQRIACIQFRARMDNICPIQREPTIDTAIVYRRFGKAKALSHAAGGGTDHVLAVWASSWVDIGCAA